MWVKLLLFPFKSASCVIALDRHLPQLSNLDVWSCSVTFYEAFSIDFCRRKNSHSFLAYQAHTHTHTQTNLKRATAAKDGPSASPTFPLKDDSRGLYRLGTSFERGLLTDVPICWGPTMPFKAMTFFLNLLIMSLFPLCLRRFSLFSSALFLLHCSSLQSLTGDISICSLVLSGWLPNRLLNLTLEYTGLWQLQYAIPSLSCVSFSQCDLCTMCRVWIKLMTFTLCLPLSLSTDCFYILYTLALHCSVYREWGSVTCSRVFLQDKRLLKDSFQLGWLILWVQDNLNNSLVCF